MCIWVGALIARGAEMAETTVAAKNPIALVIVCYMVGFHFEDFASDSRSDC